MIREHSTIRFFCFFFFFSSRRRHTRLQGDWSSDVCSSDLLDRSKAEVLGVKVGDVFQAMQALFGSQVAGQFSQFSRVWFVILQADADRSEERRVGKECRSRWSPYH